MACVALLACTGPSSAPRPDTTSSPAPELKQVWADEFDGPADSRIDSTKWHYDLGDGCQSGNCGWGNQEKEWYTSASENVSLNGLGQLRIVARPAVAGLSCYYGACRYTSAKITTHGTLNVAPGRVEARIKLPAGQGLWPAFWLLGINIGAVGWPQCGELDIMENHGTNMTSTSSQCTGRATRATRRSCTRISSRLAASPRISRVRRGVGFESRGVLCGREAALCHPAR